MRIAGKYDVLKQIGRGAFGVALLVRPAKEGAATDSSDNTTSDSTNKPAGPDESVPLDGTEVVIKKIDCTLMSKDEIAEAMNEVAVLRSLANGNPFIIGYRSAFDDQGALHIVLDYAENGDLSHVISKTKQAKKRFRQAKVLDWFVQISSALKFIHGRNILHRDLKTQNVFLDRNWQVKLGDFGIAKVLRSTTAKANTIVGTPYYLSPELCEDKPYDKKSDVWALGCVLYELCTLRHAFEGRNMCALVLRIVKGKYAPIDVGRRTGFTVDMRNLVDSLLAQDPRKRPTVPMILKKTFIQEHIRGMELHGRVNAERAIMDLSSKSLERKLIGGRRGGDADGGGGNGVRASPGASPGFGKRGRLLAEKRRKKKEARERREAQQRELEIHRKEQVQIKMQNKDDPTVKAQHRQRPYSPTENGTKGVSSPIDTVTCMVCDRKLIPPENAPRFLCPCGQIQHAYVEVMFDAPTNKGRHGGGSYNISDSSATAAAPPTGTSRVKKLDSSGVRSASNESPSVKPRSKDDNDVEARTEMERMRARQMRLLHGLATPRGQRGSTSTSRGRGTSTSPLPLTQKQREDQKSQQNQQQHQQQQTRQEGENCAPSDGALSREAARLGRDPRSLDAQYQALLQQYAQAALREENLMPDSPSISINLSSDDELDDDFLAGATMQNPPRRVRDQQPTGIGSGGGEYQARRGYGGAQKHSAEGVGGYNGRAGEPRRVRADISKFVERRRQIDPVGADMRSRERQRKRLKQQRQRKARELYVEKLKQREREFHSRRALVKQRSEDAGRQKVKELRKRVKNAKPTVNMKELRRKFARQGSSGSGIGCASKETDGGDGGDGGGDGGGSASGASSISTSCGSGSSSNQRVRDNSDQRRSRPRAKKSSGSTIDAIRAAKRRHRLAAKAAGGESLNGGGGGSDVPIEVFVPPGYSFDLGTNDETSETTTGRTTSKESSHNFKQSNSTSAPRNSAESQSPDNDLKLGETFSVGGNGDQASLQEAFQNRRSALRRKKRGDEQIPDALDEFVGDAATDMSSDNSIAGVRTSGKKNPFRRSATEGVEETAVYDGDGVIEAASAEVYQTDFDDDETLVPVSTLTPRRTSHKRPPIPPLQDAGESVADVDGGEHSNDIGSALPTARGVDDPNPLPWEDGSTLLGIDNDVDDEADKDMSGSGRGGHLRAADSTGSMENDLAGQLRCCAELSELQNPSAIDADDNEVEESRPPPPSDPPPSGTLAARCVQLRHAAEARVGPELFEKCYRYLQAVLSGDGLDDLDLDDPENTNEFYAVVKSSGISEEASRDLRQETMLLIHLESALTTANKPLE